MRIVAHRSAARHKTTVGRVQEIAAPAARLVQQQMGERLPPVEIAVTAYRGLPDLLSKAHQTIVGRRRLPKETARMRCKGTTTLTRTGVLVVVNAEACRGDLREIDATLLHELVHAIQYGRPGARDRGIRHLRNNYGIDEISQAEADAANRQVDLDEAEAERYERLAIHLA
ncbi:MAG: hypothetical protein HOY79_13555 [Streptomyces sp.]|nr:hypothetical protein [Streptomyces sp.]